MNSVGSESSKESVEKLMVNDCEIVDQSDMAEKYDIFLLNCDNPAI